MKTFFYSFILLIAGSVSVNAQWTKVNVPHDNFSFLSTLEVPNENTVWASISTLITSIAPTNKFLRTADGGATWQKKAISGAPAGFVISNFAPIDANTCYVSMYDGTDGFGGGLLKTTDGGTSWEQLGVGQIFDEFSFPDFVYFWNENEGVALGDANTDAGGEQVYLEVYTTDDKGNTWNRVPKENLPAYNELDRTIGIVNNYAVFGNRIWCQIFDGDPVAGAPQLVYRSDDLGKTWVSFPVDNTLGNFTDMTFTDELNGVALGIQNDGLFTPFLMRTTDGGETWAAVSYTGTLMGANISNVPGTKTLVSVNGIYNGPQGSSLSYDLGSTWNIIDEGTSLDHTEVKFFNSTVGWTGQFRQLSTTQGGAYKWSGGNILPVTLTSFSAAKANNSVMLKWQTANESNNAYFGIERSINGTSFTEIGRVNSIGNSSKTQQYSFEDFNFTKGFNYYRLKIVGLDGKSNYSNIEKLDLSVLPVLKLYPNPVKNILTLEGLNASALTTISIINNAGNVVKTITTSNAVYSLNIQQLPAGNYFVKVEAASKINTLQFIKE